MFGFACVARVLFCSVCLDAISCSALSRPYLHEPLCFLGLSLSLFVSVQLLAILEKCDSLHELHIVDCRRLTPAGHNFLSSRSASA